jgi:hypothetical protein
VWLAPFAKWIRWTTLRKEYGDLLWLSHLDMTDTPEIQLVVAKAFTDLGKIDAHAA